MSTPKITVIIPFYNRVGWTIEAVNSVLNQTFQDFEILLVDDGTSEDISPLLSIRDPRIKIIHQQNQGPAAARNNGMKHATGDYIAFLDSDDLFEHNKLMIQLRTHLNNLDVWFTHTSYRYINGDNIGEVIHSGRFSGSVYPSVFYDCPIASPTVMFRREVINRNIFMEEKYKISEDVIFYSKIARYSNLLGIDEPLSLVRTTNSTHAFSPWAQITGAKNLLDFIRTSSLDLNIKQERLVVSKIYLGIAKQYWEQRKPGYSILYFAKGLSNSENRLNDIIRVALYFLKRFKKYK
jgi:glycosyltransferase involved in cell wall biosynthesis